MKLDIQSMILLIQLIAQGIGAVKELSDLAKRVQNGGKITQYDIDMARVEINKAVAGWDQAVNRWDKSAKPEDPELINNDDSVNGE